MDSKATEKTAVNLKRIRLEKGLSQAELADKAGINSSYYSKIERSDLKPSIDVLEKIAKALEVKSSDIFPFYLMINNLSEFKKNYWGDNNSTEVMFHPANTLPNNPDNITSVMGAVFNDGNLLLTKPIRGWGLPGGHIEDNESPEECLRRECIEEAGVEIGNLKLIGYWKTKKLKKLESNKIYPDEGFQLLYIADAIKVNDFVPMHEVSERMFIPTEEVRNIHHNYDNFEEILNYITSIQD